MKKLFNSLMAYLGYYPQPQISKLEKPSQEAKLYVAWLGEKNGRQSYHSRTITFETKEEFVLDDAVIGLVNKAIKDELNQDNFVILTFQIIK